MTQTKLVAEARSLNRKISKLYDNFDTKVGELRARLNYLQTQCRHKYPRDGYVCIYCDHDRE